MATNIFSTTLTEGDDTLVFTGHDLFDIPWTINALGGNDSITINAGVITSGGGDWTICNLGEGNDYARVNGGFLVQVHGDNGDDQVDAYSSTSFDGGAGNDIFNIFAGKQVGFAGGSGSDTANFSADVSANIDGGDDNDFFYGNGHAVSGTISGGNGNDSFVSLRVGSAGLTLQGGAGDDYFTGTMESFNGVTIADFSVGDRIRFPLGALDITDFHFSLSGNTLTYNGFSLTFGAPLNGTLKAAPGGSNTVVLTLVAGPPPHDPANDFNGDGRSDVLWRSDAGTLTNWLSVGDGFTPNWDNSNVNVSLDWHVAGTGDFNGDGHDDILWRNSSGLTVDWLANANGGFTSNYANSAMNVPTSWQVAGIGDFNGDGHDDVLWRSDTGVITDWLGSNSGAFTSNYARSAVNVSADWHIVGTGDFNGDGRADILWRSGDGTVTEWTGQANGGFAPTAVNTAVPTDWHVVGTGDFNGDGYSDILWRSDGGTLRDWLGQANGTFAGNLANLNLIVSTSWHVVGTGDFNGDGRDDILWRNDNGSLDDWLGQANGSFADTGFNVASSWHVVSIADLNGDGRDDLLMQNSAGTVTDWLAQANGSFADNSANLSINPGTAWHVQDPFVHDTLI